MLYIKISDPGEVWVLQEKERRKYRHIFLTFHEVNLINAFIEVWVDVLFFIIEVQNAIIWYIVRGNGK
jgi:hypothetical protein